MAQAASSSLLIAHLSLPGAALVHECTLTLWLCVSLSRLFRVCFFCFRQNFNSIALGY